MVPAKPPNEAEITSLQPKQVDTAQQGSGDELERFHDVPIQVNVQLDQKRIAVADVLDLHVDSIIEMNRSAGENVDLMLDGRVIGNGEIVVIEDTLGLRVTDLWSPSDSGPNG